MLDKDIASVRDLLKLLRHCHKVDLSGNNFDRLKPAFLDLLWLDTVRTVIVTTTSLAWTIHEDCNELDPRLLAKLIWIPEVAFRCGDSAWMGSIEPSRVEVVMKAHRQFYDGKAR